MMKKPKRGQKERGTAALEFALTIPIFVAMLGFIVSVGSGLWVRYQLVDHATAAARACSMSVPTTDTSVQNCVPGVVQKDLAAAPISWCPQLVGPVVNIQTQLTSNPNLHMVSVQLSCNMSWNVMMNALNAVKGVSETMGGSRYTVTGLSQMPFLLPN